VPDAPPAARSARSTAGREFDRDAIAQDASYAADQLVGGVATGSQCGVTLAATPPL